MSLHCIVEPAGALQTGWKLSGKDPRPGDSPEADKPPCGSQEKSKARSKWERSAEKLAKIR